MLSTQFINMVMAVAAAAIMLFIIYHVVKGIIKLTVIVLVLMIIYAGYLYYIGEKLPRTGDETIQHLSERVELMREKSGGILKTILRTAPESRTR